MVLGNAWLVDAFLLQQPRGGLVGFGVEGGQHFRLQAQAGQQETTELLHLEGLQFLGADKALRCVTMCGKGHVTDALHDGLTGLHLVVLTDDNAGPEWWLVGLIATRANAGGTHAVAVVRILEFVPVKAAHMGGVAGLGFAVAFNQHDGQIAHLREGAHAPCSGRFAGVKAFIVPPKKLPQKLNERGLAAAGFAHDFQEREGHLFSPYLLCKQAGKPITQGHIARRTKGRPQVLWPALVLCFSILVDVQNNGALQALDTELAHLEIVLFVGLQHLTIVHRIVTQQVGFVLGAVAHEVHRLHHLDLL